jgi:iron(III) transport system permease protein
MLVAAPVGVVASSVFRDSGGAWAHLAETRLADYVFNTLTLAISVGALAGVIGVGAAWLVAMHRFPLRRTLGWALLLPAAVPGYIAAYAITDLLQFSGPVQTALRAATGLEAGSYWFPSIRSMPGAILILGLSLYPYVYFASRVAFASLPGSAIEASRTLGRGTLSTFFRVALPMSRPMLAAGVALVVMETIGDFGTVDYFAVDTLATGIYRTWFGLDSQTAALQLATVALGILAVVYVAEVASRRRVAVHATGARTMPPAPTRLSPMRGALACAACLAPILIGFAIPAGRLAYLAFRHGDQRALELFAGHAVNTFTLAAVSGAAAAALALVVVFTHRLRRTGVTRVVMDVCRLGYALPGPLVAIGVLTALAWLDHALNDAWTAVDGGPGPGLLLTGSVVAVLVGYQTRFLSVAVSFLESSMTRVDVRLDDAARMLSATPSRLLRTVHLPALRGALVAAGLLVLVDVAKELPATLMLRPFNFETLAVRVYHLASDERLHEASTGALAIVLVGIAPVILMSRFLDPPEHAKEPRAAPPDVVTVDGG